MYQKDGCRHMLIPYTPLCQKESRFGQKKGRLTIQCDEMWSFVANKKNKHWIWLALDVETKEIVGVYIGERSCNGAEGLWQSLPPLYRQCAVCYTDFLSAHCEIFPKSRHRGVGKKSGKTNLTHAFQLYFKTTDFTFRREKRYLSPKN